MQNPSISNGHLSEMLCDVGFFSLQFLARSIKRSRVLVQCQEQLKCFEIPAPATYLGFKSTAMDVDEPSYSKQFNLQPGADPTPWFEWQEARASPELKPLWANIRTSHTRKWALHS